MAWQQPKTTRRYLHPPMSERIFTLWREGKIIFGEVERSAGNRTDRYCDHICTGVWPVYSQIGQMFDFRNTRCKTEVNGTPIHSQTVRFGGFIAKMEAFCDTKVKATCFARITLTNTADYTASEQLGLIVRRGNEKQLVFGSPDEYFSYAPEVAVFKNAPSTFELEKDVLRDGDMFVKLQSDFPLRYEEGTLWADVKLNAKESASLTFSLGKGEAFDFDYAEERRKTFDFWQNEHKRITNVKSHKTLIYNLTTQILQCFNRLKDEERVLARQGGLQRLIWPWESIPVIEALSRIGDFADYLEPVFDGYFNEMQESDGMVRALGANWASNTGSVLLSFSNYVLYSGGQRFYDQYREQAYKAFLWVKNTRMKSDNGLFPAMQSCDWSEVHQFWTMTDTWNVFAFRAYDQVVQMFDEARKEEVREELESYSQAMRAMWKPFEDASRNSDTLRIPIAGTGNDQELIDHFYPYLVHGVFANSGFVKDGDIPKIVKHMKSIGHIKNGLHGHMPYADGDTDIYYTNWPDCNWYDIYTRVGMTEEAQQVVEAQLKYSMTKEYYMVERYSARDPWYVPWSPNASANGRMILMLLKM